MLRKLANDLVNTTSLNLQLVKLRVSRYGQNRFRAGFDEGYAVGRDHRARSLPPREYKGLPGHPQTTIRGIEVDKLMAPLLCALWDLGLETQYSCQGESDNYLPHEPLLSQKRAQIVFADFDHACKFVRKTMELLDSAAYGEGGIDISTMDRMDGSTHRAAVWFPPQLLEQITKLWLAFESEVPKT